jgi:sugar-specific transcriptional regulator TrmB
MNEVYQNRYIYPFCLSNWKTMKTVKIKNSKESDTTNASEIFLTSKDNSKLLIQMTEILSVLSKNDALTIFFIANEGIKSELDTPIKIGLTKKQYYTRLKQLVDLGLVVKNNDSYIQTAFGKVIYQKYIVGLINNIKNSKYLQMVDVLKANPKFNDSDIMEFISKVEPRISVDLESSKKISTVVSSYEDMVRKILEMIEFAQSEILLVTRFQNELIINSILRKASSGVNIRTLADTGMVEEYFRKETEIKSDKNKNERVNVVSNPFYPSKIDRRYIQVPFCLLVVDNKYVGLEIVNVIEPGKFKMAIFIEDQMLSASMISLFNNLWQKSDIVPSRIATKIS